MILTKVSLKVFMRNTILFEVSLCPAFCLKSFYALLSSSGNDIELWFLSHFARCGPSAVHSWCNLYTSILACPLVFFLQRIHRMENIFGIISSFIVIYNGRLTVFENINVIHVHLPPDSQYKLETLLGEIAPGFSCVTKFQQVSHAYNNENKTQIL